MKLRPVFLLPENAFMSKVPDGTVHFAEFSWLWSVVAFNWEIQSLPVPMCGDANFGMETIKAPTKRFLPFGRP